MKRRRVFTAFLVLIVLGAVVFVVVTGGRIFAPSAAEPPSDPATGQAYFLPISPEIEAKLTAAPDDAARLDILAQQACLVDAQQVQQLRTSGSISGNDPLLGRWNGLNERYNTTQGNVPGRVENGQYVGWVHGQNVPTAANSLSEQEDRFCKGNHPVG